MSSTLYDMAVTAKDVLHSRAGRSIGMASPPSSSSASSYTTASYMDHTNGHTQQQHQQKEEVFDTHPSSSSSSGGQKGIELSRLGSSHRHNAVHSPLLSNTPTHATTPTTTMYTSPSARLNKSSTPQVTEYSFQYTVRFLPLLVPALFILTFLGGSYFTTLLCLSILLIWTLGQLNSEEAQFVVLWCSVIAGMVCLVLFNKIAMSGVVWTTIFLFHATTLLLLLGLYASLHLRFLTVEMPDFVEVGEKLLFAMMPSNVLVIIMCGLTAILPLEYSLYYLIIIQGVMYRLYVLPLPTSRMICSVEYQTAVAKKGSNVKNRGERLPVLVDMNNFDPVLSPLLSAIYTTIYTLLPMMYHLATHVYVLSHLFTIDSILCLILPLTSLIYMIKDDAMWWSRLSTPQLAHIRKMALLATSVLTAFCLEVQVILPVLERYLVYYYSSPLTNFILVTISVYSLLFCAILLYIGVDKHTSTLNRTVMVQVLLYMATTSFSVAIGLPILLYLPMAAVTYVISHFLLSFNWVHFLGVGGGMLLGMMYFLYKQYYFLHVTYFNALTLQQLCALLVVLFLLSCIVVGLHMFHHLRALPSLLMVYGCILTMVEFNLQHASNFATPTPIYAWYFVVLTTGLGVYFSYEGHRHHHLGMVEYTLMMVVYLSKLGVLFCDNGLDLLHFTLCMGVIVPIFTIDPHQQQQQMSPLFASLHIASILMVMFLVKNTILAHVMHWTGVVSHVNETVFFSAFLLASAILVSTLVFRHFPYNITLRKWATIFLMLSLLYTLLQPRLLVFKFLHFSMDSDVFLPTLESGHIYWPQWVLFLIGSLLILSLTVVKMPRLLLALVVGTLLALYLCGNYMTYNPYIYLLYMLMFNSVSVFIIYLFYPSSSSHSLLPLSPRSILVPAYSLLIALLPITLLAYGVMYRKFRTPNQTLRDLINNNYIMVWSIHATLQLIVSLAINMYHEIQLLTMSHEKRLKHTLAYGHKTHEWSSTVGAHTTTLDNHILLLLNNLACVLSFIEFLYLHSTYVGYSSYMIFVIAPILLLLQHEPKYLPWLSEERKYIPVIGGICTYLLWNTLSALYFTPVLSAIGVYKTAVGVSALYVVKNSLLLACVLPSLYIFLSFLHTVHRISTLSLLLYTPLTVLALVTADLLPLQLLSLLALLGSLIVAYAGQVMWKHGMKLI